MTHAATYAAAETELFTDRPAASDVVHVLMPNMAYACGETILTVRGHFEMGASNFDQVTCLDCRAGGVEAIRVRMRRQQSRCIGCATALNKAGNCNACGVAQ